MKKEIKVKVKIETYRQKYCSGECPFIDIAEWRFDATCFLFDKDLVYESKKGIFLRCPECLKAERGKEC